MCEYWQSCSSKLWLPPSLHLGCPTLAPASPQLREDKSGILHNQLDLDGAQRCLRMWMHGWYIWMFSSSIIAESSPHLSPFGKSWRSLTHPRPHIPCRVRPLKRWRVELQEAQVEFAEWNRHFDLTGCVTDGVVDVNGCHSSSKIFKTWISRVSSCIFLDTTAGMALTTSTKEQTARFTRLQWRCTEHLVCYRPGTACVLVTLQQHHVYIYN